jgi:uncharacterized alkaline shock family protein YloU
VSSDDTQRDDGPPTLVATRVTSTATTPDPSAGRQAAPEPAGERGQLTIADVVVEKVAMTAAGEVDDVGGAARRVLGVKTGSDDADGRPRASARVTGETVALELRLSIAYPASVRRTTEAVSAHVRDRVHALTALTVTRVEIAVASLTSEQHGTRRVVS